MIGLLFVWSAMVISALSALFCIIAMIRRYWICYWDYVNDVEIERIPDDIIPSYSTWHMWWSCNATGTWLHLIMGMLMLWCMAWTWPISIPVLVATTGSTVHREKIRKRKEFEATLKGNKRADLVEDMLDAPNHNRARARAGK